MSKKAFTMIELTLVIVVLGILAMVAIPRMEQDTRQELADNVLSAIRYTQHLALMDNKIDPTDSNWQKKLWRIRFQTSNVDSKAISYIIFSDTDENGNPSKTECAIDPANGKYFYNSNGNSSIGADESPSGFIGKQYGIQTGDSGIVFSGGCAGYKHIAFDNMGRPHVGVNNSTNLYEGYMKDDCEITFNFIDSGVKPVTIVIEKETGYSYIK